MWLRIIKDLNISCEVHDGSSIAPRLRHPGTLDEFGHGLYIVGRLVQAWGTRYTPDGKTVWTEQALPPKPGARLALAKATVQTALRPPPGMTTNGPSANVSRNVSP